MAVLAGCGDDAAGTEITASDLEGSWLKVWTAEPYEYSPGDYADALVFDFSETEARAVFYLETVQVGGFTGYYTIGDDEITIGVTRTWNEDNELIDPEGGDGYPEWNDSDETYVFPFTFAAGGLSITTPNEDVIDLEKTAFSTIEEMALTWVSDDVNGDLLVLAPEDDYYEFEWTGENWNGYGTWEASGGTSGYIRTVVDYIGVMGDDIAYSPLSWGFLHPYVLDTGSGTLTVTIKLDGDLYDIIYVEDVVTPE